MCQREMAAGFATGSGSLSLAIGRDAAENGGPVYCENCGHPNASSAIYCEKCGRLLNTPE